VFHVRLQGLLSEKVPAYPYARVDCEPDISRYALHFHQLSESGLILSIAKRQAGSDQITLYAAPPPPALPSSLPSDLWGPAINLSRDISGLRETLVLESHCESECRHSLIKPAMLSVERMEPDYVAYTV
jgi:hypothetical protein